MSATRETTESLPGRASVRVGPPSLLARLAILAARGYKRWISPLLGERCRFYPTCSQYFIGSVEKYGFWRGSFRGIRRLLKCHPFHPGGVDLP